MSKNISSKRRSELVVRLAGLVKEEGYEDTDIDAVLQILINEGPKVSVSKLQRRLRYGHDRARRILQCCEKAGLGYYENFEGLVMPLRPEPRSRKDK